MRIRISSRKSDLARIQAFEVGRVLKKINPHLEISFFFKESLGDKNLTDPLWKMPEKGVFTEDFLSDLVTGETDLVVHSWKDLPIELRSQTKIVATLPRADQRDVLLFKKKQMESVTSSKKLRLFSSSPRRAYNLEPFLKEALPIEINDVVFEPVRGNVPTRVQKLIDGDMDGLIVAKAALDRLLEAEDSEFKTVQRDLRTSLAKCLVMVLPLEKNPSAPAQGALAIEIRNDRKDLEEILSQIHCPKTWDEVLHERNILKDYGGGCHQKVGVSCLIKKYGKIIFTRALTDNGEKVESYKYFGNKNPPLTTEDKIFPVTPSEGKWFERHPLKVTLPLQPLWIAKAEALPDGTKVPLENTVWTSGWESWKKLAKRGIWISGCSEGLGESDGPALGPLFNSEKPWVKLTHDLNPPGLKILPTYRLIPLKNPPQLASKTHFFWMSGTSFLRALEIYPWIKDAYNSCGPGNTFETLSKHTSVTVFPTHGHWKEKVLK